jgi:hypothetical protein
MEKQTTRLRRLALRVFALTLSLGLLIPSATASFQTSIEGCALTARSAAIGDLGQLLPGGTGYPVLDLGMQTDILELQRHFGVSAKMFLMRESGGPNAFALSPQHSAAPQILGQYRLMPQASPDGVVLLGMNLMTAEFNSAQRTGYGVPSIIGHEYAHVMQFKNGFPAGGKWMELHADYLAGWFTAHRAVHLPHDVNESANSFFSKGDYEFNNASHHGTPTERLGAFMAGFNVYKSNVTDARSAYQQGIAYLRSRGLR